MEILRNIKLIHPNVEVINGILHLIGNVSGEELEKIDMLWKGDVYVDCLYGTYNSKGIHIKIGRNNGTVQGDMSNVNICYKSNKKLKKAKKLLFKGKGWK